MLRRKQRQLVRVDDYGVVDRSRWEREVGYFFDRVVCRRLAGRDAALVAASGWAQYRERLEAVVAGPAGPGCRGAVRAGAQRPEFEEFCAQELQRAGWRVTLTGASRDQGADLVAERAASGWRCSASCSAGRSATTRCRRWWPRARTSRPTGRWWLQPALHRELPELAATNGVELCHWSELARL